MKKVLCIVFVLIMTFSASLPAFAAETGNKIAFDKTEKVSVEEKRPAKYSFTAPRDAVYSIYAMPMNLGGALVTVSLNGDESSESLMYSFEDKAEDGTVCGACTSACCIEMLIKSGTEIEVKFEVKPEKFNFIQYGSEKGYQSDRIGKPFDFELTFSYTDVKKLNIGENKALNDGEYFVFRPEKTGIYTFSSYSAEGNAPYAYIYEENTDINQKYGLADSEERDDGIFDMTVRLEEGRNYLIYFYMEDADEEHVQNGRLDCTVSQETKKTVILFETVKYYANKAVEKVESFFHRITDKIKEKLSPVFDKLSRFFK